MKALAPLRAMTLGALPWIPSLLFAQTATEPDLYIPPVLTVKASTNHYTARGLAYGMPVEARDLGEELPIRRHISVKTDALLPMIFFEAASSSIPERFTTFSRPSDADDYREDRQIVRSDIRPDPLPKYHEVLNVIGSRLQRYPGTTISLEGSYSTEPGESAQIGRERAEVVKEYFERIWRIAPDRMTILPARRACDSSDYPFRQEEARRVTIESESRLIHDPVRYHYAIIEQPLITLMMTVDPKVSPETVSGMSVLITSDDDPLGTTTIPTSPDSTFYRLQFVWSLPRTVDALDHGVTFQILLILTDGTRRLSEPVTLPVRIISPPPEDEERAAAIMRHLTRDVKSTTTKSRKSVEKPDAPVDEPSEEERIALEMSGPYKLASVEFFVAGDPTLRRYQRMMIDHCIATLLSDVDERNAEDLVLLLLPNGEEGENPEADPVEMAIGMQSARNERLETGSLFTDPTFRASLVPLEQWIHTFVDTSGSDVDSNFEERWRDFNKRMYGDHGDEMIASYMHDGHSPPEYSTSERRGIDSLLRQRAAPVIEYVRSIMPEGTFDSIAVEPQHLRMFSSRMPTLYLPEERFYARRVTMAMKRSGETGVRRKKEDEETK